MRNVIILLTMLFFANIEAYNVQPEKSLDQESLYERFVEDYKNNHRWNNLLDNGYLEVTEVNTLTEKEKQEYANKLMKCSKTQNFNVSVSKEFCTNAYKKALNRFIEGYSGSVADSVVKSAVGVLKKFNPKAYTVER